MPQSTHPLPRLLLVEDDPMVSDVIIMMLEDDYAVVHAASAAPALQVLRSAEVPAISVVLLDCLLPHGNVANVLLSADRQAIPVVLISGDPNQAQALDPSRPFLVKPFTQQMLLDVLDIARR
jgi:DNA-binding NtrC family response regulator